MRCPTMEVNIDGEKVIINVADFNADIMAVWVDYNPDVVTQEQLHVPGELNEALSPVMHASRLVPPPPPLIKNFNGT